MIKTNVGKQPKWRQRRPNSRMAPNQRKNWKLSESDSFEFNFDLIFDIFSIAPNWSAIRGRGREKSERLTVWLVHGPAHVYFSTSRGREHDFTLTASSAHAGNTVGTRLPELRPSALFLCPSDVGTRWHTPRHTPVLRQVVGASANLSIVLLSNYNTI